MARIQAKCTKPYFVYLEDYEGQWEHAAVVACENSLPNSYRSLYLPDMFQDISSRAGNFAVKALLQEPFVMGMSWGSLKVKGSRVVFKGIGFRIRVYYSLAVWPLSCMLCDADPSGNKFL